MARPPALLRLSTRQRAGLAFTDLDGLGASCTAETHESMTLGYRLLGDGTRAIGKMNPGGNERLAPCTEKRRRELGYNPKNLAAFLQTTLPESEWPCTGTTASRSSW